MVRSEWSSSTDDAGVLERLPGVTDTGVQRWADMPVPVDGHGLLADVLNEMGKCVG